MILQMAWDFAESLDKTNATRGHYAGGDVYLWHDVLNFDKAHKVLAFMIGVTPKELDEMKVRMKRSIVFTRRSYLLFFAPLYSLLSLHSRSSSLAPLLFLHEWTNHSSTRFARHRSTMGYESHTYLP